MAYVRSLPIAEEEPINIPLNIKIYYKFHSDEYFYAYTEIPMTIQPGNNTFVSTNKLSYLESSSKYQSYNADYYFDIRPPSFNGSVYHNIVIVGTVTLIYKDRKRLTQDFTLRFTKTSGAYGSIITDRWGNRKTNSTGVVNLNGSMNMNYERVGVAANAITITSCTISD